MDKALQKLLSDQNLVASGADVVADLHTILIAAMQSETWDAMDKSKQIDLAFRVTQLAEFMLKLDSYTQNIHANAA